MASDWLWGDRIHKTVILDSSAILMLFEYSIDLENELTRILGNYKIAIPKPIIKELKFLSEKGKGKKRMNARASLKYLDRYDIIDSTDKDGDDSIIDISKKINSIIVTNDTQLRNRLKDMSVPVIFLRAKKKLVME